MQNQNPVIKNYIMSPEIYLLEDKNKLISYKNNKKVLKIRIFPALLEVINVVNS